MEVTKLRVLHMEEPLGIDRNPYFSWKLESQQNDTVQSTYHITVREQDSDKIVWDTGVQHGRANAFIPYGGAPLRSKTRYCWEVRVEDNHGGVSDATSYFETAFLNAGDWKADWVESALPIKKRGKGLGKQCPATMFRKSFFVDGNVQKARLYATCHGVYRLTVNGKKVDDREMAPEYSSYEKVLCYQVYDLTDMLEKGENVIGLYVGEGWYFCGETAMSPKALKESHAVLFQLEMELADGEKKMVLSDGGVKTSYGPVQSSDLFAGEVYDAREEKIGWDAPGYDDARWTPARPCKKQSYENLVAQLGEPVSCVRELPAIKHYVSPKGELIYDFGQNFAGKVRIHVDAPAGTEIRLDLFEVTDAQGNYFNSILSTQGVGAGADQAIRFVSNGTGQTYEPYFVFLGFRYARLTGAEQARSIELTGLSLSSRMEETGTFSCSDARLNQLYSNIRWSQRSNMLSIPTDCPQREKAGWTGDISIYAETSLLNEDTTAFLTRWLSSLRADQHENGAVPMVVPFNHTYQKMMKLLKLSGGNHGSVGVAGWGDASVTVPYTMYKVTGNKEVLAENYDAMKRWCDYILQSAKRKGDKTVPKEEEQWLWNTGFHYGEWLIPSISKAGMTDGKSMMKMMGTAQYTAPICGYRSIREMSEIAGILDREEDAAYYADVASHMKHAIGTYLIRQDGKLRWEYMGAYVMLLAFDLVPEPEKEAVVSHLVQMIHDNGDCLDTGFLATPFLLDVLSKNGHEDLAYRLLLQTKAPSWLYEVEHGATTIWESWFGYKEDGNPQIVSMNHYSFGVVADWMFRNICGIRREEAGFLRFRIQPRPVSPLTFASRTFETENGKLPGWLKWVWTGKGLAFSLNVVLMMQVTYYCTDLLGMPATLVGSLLMASKVVDACTDLIAGYIIDHTHTKWGKARPYEIFIVLTWVGTVFLFSVPNFGTVGKAVYVFILYALVNSICATFIMASDPVYMSHAIRSEKNKMSLASFQGAFIMIGSILVGIVMPQLIKTLGAEKSGWTIIALVFAVPLSIIGSVRMLTVKEVAAQSQVKGTSKTNFSIREGIRALLKNRMVLLLCGMAVLSNAISAVGTATSTYYFKWVFGDIGMVSLINLPTMLTPLLLAFAPVLSRKIGTGKLMRFGLAAAVLGYVVRLIGDVNLATIMLGTVLTAVGSIPLGTLLSIYEMECMDYGEWKTGVRVEGMITSTAGFFVRVGSAVGSGMLGLLMGLSGYVSSETAVSQPDNAINMIKFLFNGLPLMLAVGTLVLSVFYTIDKVRGQMYKDLNKN